jgi:hypothetical protein
MLDLLGVIKHGKTPVFGSIVQLPPRELGSTISVWNRSGKIPLATLFASKISSKFALRGNRHHLLKNSLLSDLASCRSDSNPFITEPLSVTSIRLSEWHLVVCRFGYGSFEGDACINCSRCLVEDSICMNLLGLAEEEISNAIEDGCLKVFIETQSIDKLERFCYLLSEIP